jgi:hypothetical protein
MLTRIGVIPALLACTILCGSCSGGPEEMWNPEVRVETEELAPAAYTEARTAGKLTLRLSQKVRITETPSERLHLLHTETYSVFDLDEFSLVFFSVLGAIVTVGLYVLFALYLYNPDDEEN